MNEPEQPQAATITNEQTWVEAATPLLLGPWDSTTLLAEDRARALWPLVQPLVTRAAEASAEGYGDGFAERKALVTRAEDAERRIQAVRDLLPTANPELIEGGYEVLASDVLRALDGQ